MRGGFVPASVVLALSLWLPAAQAQRSQAAEPLLTVTDPAGDAQGDGNLQLPTQPAIPAEALDLRSFEVWPREGGGLTFRVGFGTLENPWNAPGGFSAQTLDIFVKTQSGGQTGLADLNMRTAGGGWQYHLRVTGFGSHWTHASEEPLTGLDTAEETSGEAERPANLPAAPRVRTEGGNTLVIETDLGAGQYAYWVTSSVYSPFSRGGVLVPGGSGTFALTSPSGDGSGPVPVDLLMEEASPQPFNLGVADPVGELRDFRPGLLWGLGLLGLATGVGAGAALWRTPREQVQRSGPN
ncbi:glucodextranase DOMON-like domain-containing protein [Deinococcus radiophilus]|uniref:glucodextranase DOMON-like domain-containing protein n=1 Tax=Deinococcus radiophilus TaxID=32062 RepID=UPI001E47D4EF|nr:glucodextranase DOMON-like domain-containing protein [Deinococcus radiophilus]UFA50813.1 regulator [Deinococcus radiophilus]